MKYDVIVIGGGPAGIMAALTAADYGKNILILEKRERLGRKLLITGKGRCNLTNNCTPEDFFANVPVNPRFLYSAYSQFSAQDTMAYFENLGVELKTERGNRVFPTTDKAMTIVDALAKAVKSKTITVKSGEVSSLNFEDGKVIGVNADNSTFFADCVCVATGGKSYPLTGSTGDGYKFAVSAGHKIVPPKPSLVPIVTEERWVSDVMGLSLKNCTLTLNDTKKNKRLFSEMGELLFTHFGLSGPLVLSASSHIREPEKDRYLLEIDLKPALDFQTLDSRLQKDFSGNINKNFVNSLDKLLPSKIISSVIRLSHIPADKKVNQITREERHRLVSVLKAFPLHFREFRPIEEAIITSGGVCVSEIYPKTMESKLCSGLYFAGEVIDVDAYTGGFNLQIAFSTGYAAGVAMGERY
ncbi:MAG: NAD(P)/FAD-dependent oxidoreductase [Ruminococcus sp.]|nr:NAD(P)/FAD-dependent oxidoreductase [Ruminococcus sp.]